MPVSGLMGKIFKAKRCPAPVGGVSSNSVPSFFEGAEDFGSVSLASAKTTVSPPDNVYLYNTNGVFQPQVAQSMDACSSTWQLVPFLVFQYEYNGRVPVDEFLSLFPNKRFLEVGYIYYFYLENYNLVISVYPALDTLIYREVMFYADTGTIESADEGCPLNLITLGGPATARIYWLYSFIRTDVTNSYYWQNGVRYNATQQNNGVWMGRRATLSSPRGLNDLLEDDFVPPSEPSDPYYPGGESDTGGGTGNFDGTSVDVDFTSLPTLSAVDTGFISLYNPTLAQLQSLANYMWSDLFDLDTFKKLFGDPMQAILGLSIVPGPVPSSGAQVVKVGNISTGISINKAASQYINIDCGTLNVEEFWGAYLDYEPYTKAEIYLPFIGVHQIAVDDIMNKPVHIMYHIDLLSGGCACEIKCGGSVLYTFIGSCSVSIPVTGSDWTNLINGVLSAASAIGTMVASGGATAPAAAGEIASAATNSLKPSIEKSGSVAGAGGLLAGKVPVLILTRPRQALPGKQNTFTGYPAFITRSLGGLSGYTEVHSIRLSGIDGTESEIDEIEELLKGGVIL